MCFRNKKIEEMKTGASAYIENVYTPQSQQTVKQKDDPGIKFSSRNKSEPRYSALNKTDIELNERDDSDIFYSRRNLPKEISSLDRYDERTVTDILKSFRNSPDMAMLSSALTKTTSGSFVACVNAYIKQKHLSDSEVYKAAGLDRRLFSKMMSDFSYKPSKDTAIAVAFALRLTLTEAEDLLNRAGYSLSHSIKRDIIIEFFFRKRFTVISKINTVLFELGEKPLGR